MVEVSGNSIFFTFNADWKSYISIDSEGRTLCKMCVLNMHAFMALGIIWFNYFLFTRTGQIQQKETIKDKQPEKENN